MTQSIIFANSVAFVDEHHEGTIDFDYDAIDRGNPLVAEITEATGNRDLAIVERFTRAIAEIYHAKNSKKSALCFMIATGSSAAQGRQGSKRDKEEDREKRQVMSASDEFGVTKQDISKTCVAWCEFMGIPPSDYMRREASKESFRKSNKRKQKL